MPRHRLLVIGVGSIGERHVRCAQRTKRAEVAICEVNNDVRNAIAGRYQIQSVSADILAALKAQPTAAVICTPAAGHIPLARQLVKAGIHVLIEKPLSTSLDGIDQLKQAVNERGVAVAVGYVYRANPVLAQMRAAIHSGRFGRPLQLVAVAGQHFPAYRPAYAQTYYKERATGGGAIQDALTHIINACEWIIGPIDRVLADAGHQFLPNVAVEDTVHVIARHQGIPACYALNQYQAPNEITVTIACERGTARFEAQHQHWQWMTEPGNEWYDESFPTLERDDLFINQLHAFFDSIEHGTAPLCTLEEGAQTLQVNLAILRSLEKASWTSINSMEVD